MRVLMVGVNRKTKGGMWTVIENYLEDKAFCTKTNLIYLPTATLGSMLNRVLFTAISYIKILFTLSIIKVDIVHIHMSERGSVYRKSIVQDMAKWFKCKIILHLHGATFEDWYKDSNKKTQQYVRNILNKADKIVILGEYWRTFITSLIENEEKIEVIYNAVMIPPENNYNNLSTNLLFLGAVCQRKGINDLLDCINIIRDKLPNQTKLLIYGVDEDGNIEEKILSNNLNNKVIYKGWLKSSDKPNVFSQIALSILPSYNEGLPMTILETMAYGIPNISTNVAAIPEVITAGLDGEIILAGSVEQLGTAIIDLINNDDKRKLFSHNAYENTKFKFSFESHKKYLLSIYEQLLQ